MLALSLLYGIFVLKVSWTNVDLSISFKAQHGNALVRQTALAVNSDIFNEWNRFLFFLVQTVPTYILSLEALARTYRKTRMILLLVLFHDLGLYPNHSWYYAGVNCRASGYNFSNGPIANFIVVRTSLHTRS